MHLLISLLIPMTLAAPGKILSPRTPQCDAERPELCGPLEDLTPTNTSPDLAAPLEWYPGTWDSIPTCWKNDQGMYYNCQICYTNVQTTCEPASKNLNGPVCSVVNGHDDFCGVDQDGNWPTAAVLGMIPKKHNSLTAYCSQAFGCRVCNAVENSYCKDAIWKNGASGPEVCLKTNEKDCLGFKEQ